MVKYGELDQALAAFIHVDKTRFDPGRILSKGDQDLDKRQQWR